MRGVVKVWDAECMATGFGVILVSGVCYKVSERRPLYQSGRRLLPSEISLPRKLEAMDRLVLIPFSILQGILGILAAWNVAFAQDYRSRWYETNSASRWCISLYVAKTTFDVITQLSTLGDTDAKRIDIMLHHILSAVCIGYGGYVSGQCHFFGSVATISEVTTLFLNNIMATKLFTGERTKSQKIFVAINGILLWLSYIIFRLVLFSFWLWRFFTDIWSHNNTANTKDNLISTISKFQLFMYPLTVVVILFLSTHWFLLITRGLFKQIIPASSKKTSVERTTNLNNRHKGDEPSSSMLSQRANSNSAIASAVVNKVK